MDAGRRRNLLIQKRPAANKVVNIRRRFTNHWLANQDERKDQVFSALVDAYGRKAAPLWFQRWRRFWMSCAEMFGYANGREWLGARKAE